MHLHDEALEAAPYLRHPVVGVHVGEARHAGIDAEPEKLLMAQVERILALTRGQFPPDRRLFADVESGGGDRL